MRHDGIPHATDAVPDCIFCGASFFESTYVDPRKAYEAHMEGHRILKAMEMTEQILASRSKPSGTELR
jgi:hypothetical protein